MAYVPGYAHDVFISYAHVNNIPPRPNGEGWVSIFHDSLMRHLPAFLKRGGDAPVDPVIWRDDKLGGADFYDDTIDAAVRNSAVMISVMSERYFESEYCVQELQSFCDTGVTVDFETGKKSRVFKVMLSDIPHESQDARVRRTNGFEFFARENGGERLFRRTTEEMPDDGYWKAVERLAREVAEVLSRLAERRSDAAAQPAGPAVYLAEVTDDLEDYRAEVRDALKQHGIQVLPELRLPTEARALRKEVAKDLGRAALSVHLMGSWPGKAADGDPLPATQIQYRLASSIGVNTRDPNKLKLRRVVWLPPDLDLASVRSDTQRQFLESLRYERDAESPMEMFQKSIEELKDEIIRKLLPPPPKVSKFEVKRKSLVYITHHPADALDAEAIKGFLREVKQDVMLMRGEGEREQLKDLRLRMKSCHAVLILYGKSPLLWTRAIAEEAWKIANRRQRNPLLAKSICDGPPDPKLDLGLDFEGWPILQCRKGIEVGTLEPFIKAVVM